VGCQFPLYTRERTHNLNWEREKKKSSFPCDTGSKASSHPLEGGGRISINNHKNKKGERGGSLILSRHQGEEGKGITTSIMGYIRPTSFTFFYSLEKGMFAAFAGGGGGGGFFCGGGGVGHSCRERGMIFLKKKKKEKGPSGHLWMKNKLQRTLIIVVLSTDKKGKMESILCRFALWGPQTGGSGG